MKHVRAGLVAAVAASTIAVGGVSAPAQASQLPHGPLVIAKLVPNPCKLLTEQDVESILGQAVTGTTQTSNDPFWSPQDSGKALTGRGCAYKLEYAMDIVTIEVALDRSGRNEFWDNVKTDLAGKLTPVRIGDDAFVLTDRAGTLYVRQGQYYLKLTSATDYEHNGRVEDLARVAAARLPK